MKRKRKPVYPGEVLRDHVGDVTVTSAAESLAFAASRSPAFSATSTEFLSKWPYAGKMPLASVQ